MHVGHYQLRIIWVPKVIGAQVSTFDIGVVFFNFTEQTNVFMAKKVSEHDALKIIDLQLEELSSEERQRIFDWINQKYKLIPSQSPSNLGTAGSAGKNSNNLNPSGTIKDFIALKKPQGFYERIACLVYYLENVQGVPGVKTADITKANTDAKQTKIPDSSVYVANATKVYGFLISIGAGKKGLSARGEAVVNALPDRDAVKTALDENPLKKKAKKRNKK